MNYKKLGNADLKVSTICLGTMTWGEQNKEKEAFFKQTMIVEKKKMNEKNKLSKYKKDEILREIRLREKKNSKERKRLKKQIRLEEKHISKKTKVIKKQAKSKEKQCLSWQVENRSIKECLKPLIGGSSNKSKKEIAKETLSLEKIESFSTFNDLVRKINEKNLSKPYPDINVVAD